MLIPVFPFQLQKLGYSDVSGLVGWLLFAYVSDSYRYVAELCTYLTHESNFQSGGLVICMSTGTRRCDLLTSVQ